MKVVGFVGSPRKGGNTDVLVAEILRGAESSGATVEKVYLNELNIRGCQACDGCRGGDTYNGCVVHDDMIELYDKMIEADALVLGTPIYNFGPSGQTKTFLDRWYAFWYVDKGGLKSMLNAKPMALALAYGDRNPFNAGATNAYLTFRDEANWNRMRITDVVHASADKPGEIAGNAAVMADAFGAGKRLAMIASRK